MEEIKNEVLDPIGDVNKEILCELAKEKAYNKATLNKTTLAKSNFILTLLEKMLGKLLFKLKIKIVVLWDDKELFTYVIPKN